MKYFSKTSLLFMALTLCNIFIFSNFASAEYTAHKKPLVIYKMQPIADDADLPADMSLISGAIDKNSSIISDEFKAKNYTASDLKCLSEVVYHEARGESTRGGIAVAEVVLNRAKSPNFPKTICGVMAQKYRGSCQFSFMCNGLINKSKNAALWKKSQEIAKSVLDGQTQKVSGGALYFHASYVRPSWTNRLSRTTKIGAHTFYK